MLSLWQETEKDLNAGLYTCCSSPYCSQRAYVITLFLQVHVPLSIAEVAGFLRLQGASLGQHVCKKEDIIIITFYSSRKPIINYYKDQFLLFIKDAFPESHKFKTYICII